MLSAVGKHSVDQHSVDIGTCACCGFRTGSGTCPVCFWTNDGRTDPDAVVPDGPNGDLSLSHARLNFAIYGASHPRYQEMVRPPHPYEQP